MVTMNKALIALALGFALAACKKDKVMNPFKYYEQKLDNGSINYFKIDMSKADAVELSQAEGMTGVREITEEEYNKALGIAV